MSDSPRAALNWFFLGAGIFMALYGVAWRGRGALQRAQQNGIALMGIGVASSQVDKFLVASPFRSIVEYAGLAAILLACYFVARAAILKQRGQIG